MKYITKEEFDDVLVKSGSRRPTSPEFEAVLGLAVNQGFVTPCRWKHRTAGNHRGTGACSGISHVHNISRSTRTKIKVSCRCWEKYIYVMRVA